LLADHLGSVESVTDSSGNFVVRESFDAWGKRRNPVTWSGAINSTDDTNIASTTRRGFTGHTELDNFGLVHMNGRVYDPVIGRFLSADPYIQAPDDTQSWNRYAYVRNNPLSLIDPSGYSWLSSAVRSIGRFVSTYWRPIVAIAAAYFTFGAVSGWIAASAGTTSAAAATAAGLSAQVGYAIGYGAAAASWTTAAIAGAAAGAVAGGITGGVRGAVVGGLSGFAFGAGNAAWAGISNSFVRGAGQAVTAGAVGGGSSEALGGTFRDGFIFAFAANASASIYRAMTGGRFDPTWRDGDTVVDKSEGGLAATPYSENVGFSSKDATSYIGKWSPFGYEGTVPMRALGRIPGFNSFATAHDLLQAALAANSRVLAAVSNFPSMGPVLVFNYAGLLAGTPSVLAAANKENSWW
jgi:RHS repeat-associated protein